ncbi:hypothetical protein [Candidatus Rhodobacter oscarellae]|uniref:hypothetical protein n=1 Tax=Candidatus Rhodobacter oscarellae TaxID=1675527 RepID=UPI001F3E5B58|nr:hypothetical protein [Candidatus Rhodobacter lobularis]
MAGVAKVPIAANADPFNMDRRVIPVFVRLGIFSPPFGSCEMPQNGMPFQEALENKDKTALFSGGDENLGANLARCRINDA